MQKLYIANKIVNGTFGLAKHLYIVFDPDGNPSSGDELILRGGPENLSSPLGHLTLELGVGVSESLDGLADPYYEGEGLPNANDRNFTLLAEGTQAEVYWDLMISFAATLASVAGADEGDTVVTPLDYDAAQANSNSTITSVMAAAGLDIYSNLPVIGGDLDGDGIKDGDTATERVDQDE